MAIRGIDPDNFAYYPPNFPDDIQKNKRYIFLEKYFDNPELRSLELERIRILIIKSNFEAKKNLIGMGNFAVLKKTPLQQYRWQVIKMIIRILGLIPVFGVILGVSDTIPRMGMSNHLEKYTAFLFMALLLPVMFCFIVFVMDSTKVFDKTLDAYQKPHVDFLTLLNFHNSMEGFDPNQLANAKSAKGWEDPITLEEISVDQISSTKMLRIGTYAIPIRTALESMLTRSINESPQGEIPHPIEQRKLSPDEKVKFLHETSAFFAIKNPQALEACWNEQVTSQEVASITFRAVFRAVYRNEITPLQQTFITPSQQTSIEYEIIRQILPMKRKQAFLKLLPRSVRELYFGANFRSTSFSIPRIQVPTLQQIVRFQLSIIRIIILLIAQTFAAQRAEPAYIPTSTTGQ